MANWNHLSKHTSAETRFMARVKFTDGCWEWLGAQNFGYGVLMVDGVQSKAYRYAYEQVVGPIPDGYQIDHLCRNHRCVRPDHLEAVTPRTNVLRGDTVTAANAAKTHCKNGHLLDASNTWAWIGTRKAEPSTLVPGVQPREHATASCSTQGIVI